jgi:uncharacterized protein YdiU (UPF0061 family)
MYRMKKQNEEFRDDIAILSDILKENYFIHGFVEGYLYFYAPKPVTDERIEPELKDISPHYELVNKRVLEKIRTLYTIEDELKIHRLRHVEIDEFNDYNAWCEECKNWGRTEKAKMGFVSE